MSDISRVFGAGWANKVTLYVPSTVDVDRPLDANAAESVVTRSLHLLAGRFGGATAIRAQGAWLAENGLVLEGTTLVYAFSAQLTIDDLTTVKAFCEALKVEMRQEAIAVEVNGELLFV